jgi:hypothetical protein
LKYWLLLVLAVVDILFPVVVVLEVIDLTHPSLLSQELHTR